MGLRCGLTPPTALSICRNDDSEWRRYAAARCVRLTLACHHMNSGMLYMIYYVHVLEIYKNHVNYASNFEIFVNVIKVLILCT